MKSLLPASRVNISHRDPHEEQGKLLKQVLHSLVLVLTGKVEELVRTPKPFSVVRYQKPNQIACGWTNGRTCNLMLRSQNLSYMLSHWCRPPLGLASHAVQEVLCISSFKIKYFQDYLERSWGVLVAWRYYAGWVVLICWSCTSYIGCMKKAKRRCLWVFQCKELTNTRPGREQIHWGWWQGPL